MSEFKYAYNQLVYHGEDIARSIDRVARFGYDAIEVVGEPTELNPRRVKRLADGAGRSCGLIRATDGARIGVVVHRGRGHLPGRPEGRPDLLPLARAV
jgi:hypothetical protein